MGNLKGSKTHENLKAAFAGESQANRHYLYFAKEADVWRAGRTSPDSFATPPREKLVTRTGILTSSRTGSGPLRPTV